MTPAEFGITDKVVLITGAGRGIGKGIAEVLTEAGADVALNARHQSMYEPGGGGTTFQAIPPTSRARFRINQARAVGSVATLPSDWCVPSFSTTHTAKRRFPLSHMSRPTDLPMAVLVDS
jgi:hypothetical protein